MTTMLANSPHGKGEIRISDDALGKGGEGSVYPITYVGEGLDFLPDADELVAKIYHEGHGEPAKIRSMLLSPPESEAVMWPLAALFRGRKFAGFIMKKLDFDTNRPWSDLAHSGKRRKTAQDFDVSYAMTTIRNFAVALADVHEAGHMVGDINESNMFVANDAQVYLVDTDSAQVTDPKTGNIFNCMVGKPEYTASEISHGKLKDQIRTVETETFGFAVAAYQMLLGGPHPADAVYKGDDEPPAVIDKIRKGIFPALQGKNGKFFPPKRVAIAGVPSKIREILKQSLNPDPSSRPNIDDIIDVFDDVNDNLIQCQQIKQHWYDQRDQQCGWCLHSEKTGIDPWSPEQKQTGLPSKNNNGRRQKQLSGLDYGKSNNNSLPKRLPPQRAGSNNSSQTPGTTPSQSHYQNSPSQSLNNYPSQTQQNQYSPYPSNAYPPAQGYPPAYQEPEPPSQKELKKRFKTSKTVLKYNDGTYEPRPPIGELMRSNPKLAFSCLKDETPGFAAFWWSNRKAVPHWWALIIGLVISVGFIVLWWLQMPEWLNLAFSYTEWEWEWLEHIKSIMAWTSVIGVAITSSWMTLSGLFEDARYLKKYKTLKGINKENWVLTILRYVSISIIWGPILMIGTIILSLVLLFNLIFAVIQSESNKGRY